MGTIPAAALDRAGIAGETVLLPACAVLQIGLIRGQGDVFASLVCAGRSNMLNLSSTLLQANSIVISLTGIQRTLFLDRAIRFNEKEKALLPETFSIPPRIAARQRVDMRHWLDAQEDMILDEPARIFRVEMASLYRPDRRPRRGAPAAGPSSGPSSGPSAETAL